MVGGPSWLTSDRFDIVAKAPDNASPEQMPLMLRALLADRFKLVVHTESRELPIYALVLARGDGKLGKRSSRGGRLLGGACQRATSDLITGWRTDLVRN